MKRSARYITTLTIALLYLLLGAHSHASRFKQLESTSEEHIGVYAINTKNNDIVGYRENDIFPMGCTSKVIGVAAVLKVSFANMLRRHSPWDDNYKRVCLRNTCVDTLLMFVIPRRVAS